MNPNQLISYIAGFDTPTICNAIEMAEKKRGFDNFTHHKVLAAFDQAKPIVGYAKTARIKASQPSTEPISEVKKKRMAYYKYVSQIELPSICVIEDVDFPNPVGAYWGEINSWVHKGFGLKGVLTNGLMRDLDNLAPDFQILAASIGVSHAFVHIVDFDQTVEVFGLKVRPGDLIHADKHGAVVIPNDIIPILAENIEKLIETEKIVLEAAQGNDFNFDSFEKAWSAFEKARI